ncbi:hypothetical protein L0222_02500 [bacterium]|nr:hypothetical protein [bacterium]
MKFTHLTLIIPFLLYTSAALILDPGELLPMYPDADLTPYLAAVSLAKDGDLAYTREDSDRYMRQYDWRPFPFRILQKKIINSSGEYKAYFAFHYPELFLFLLVPFLAVLGFRGWLVLHALLILGIYIMGWIYYRGKDTDAISPALNSVVYFTLIPLPVLFLLPSHHLFLISICTAFLFFGLKGWPVLSAVFLAIAFSSQPWAAVFCLFLLGYWQSTTASRTQNPISRFVIALVLALFVVWGLERLIYPVENISEPRWVTTGTHLPLSNIWQSLPNATHYAWSSPSPQRLIDFLFGRNSGFFVYAFVAGALLLSSLWLIRDSLVRAGLLFVILYFGLMSVIDPSIWSAESLANDFWILLCPLPYFLVPLIRPKNLFISIAVPAAFLIGPLLANPLGAITNRSYYTSSFPYKFLPVEISLAGRAGITKEPAYQQQFTGGKIYFLNDSFYKEHAFFWLRGESTLEFLLELKNPQTVKLELRNGVVENKITLKFKDSQEEIRLTTVETKIIDISRHLGGQIHYEGRIYIHGKIHTNSGYVPGLLSRDNPDYRFLSCQVHINPLNVARTSRLGSRDGRATLLYIH